MKIESLDIVDRVTGNTVVSLDGSKPSGIVDPSGRLGYPYKDLNVELLAASVDKFVHVVNFGVWRVAAVRTVISVSGGSGANVDVMVGDRATAPASATSQLTAAIDLEETAPNGQNGTLIASPTRAYPGMAVSLNFSGTLTGLVGLATITLERIA